MVRGLAYRIDTVQRPGRLLVANVGLDGHDRGLKAMSGIMRDAGHEVIYTGLFQSPAAVVSAVVAEDVDAVGLSMLPGAQVALASMVLHELRRYNVTVPVFVYGVVADGDAARLSAVGVAAVLPLDLSAAQLLAEIDNVLALDAA